MNIKKRMNEQTNRFFPAFTWTEWAGVLIEAITPGVGKAQPASSGASKQMKILETLSKALQTLSEDKWQQVPLIIVEGFTSDNRATQDSFIVLLVKWLDFISHYKLARVIFTADASFDISGGLHEIIPYSRIDKIVLTDAPLNFAISAVEKELKEPLSIELINAISRLGGRYNDLNTFLLKVQGGQSPSVAINEMLDIAVDDIREVLFKSSSLIKQHNPEYSSVHVWKVILKIAENDFAYYDDILFNVFKGDENALKSLIRTKLFSVIPVPGSSDKIQATSPLLLSAFKKIADDRFVRPGMDLLVAKAAIEDEQKKLALYEKELAFFQKFQVDGHSSPVIDQRVEFLLSLIEESLEKQRRSDNKRKNCEILLR
jgi:hypothetical protein